MRSVYQHPKNPSFGVNMCQGCLDKQREIDRLKSEIQSLRSQLSRKRRKDKEGFFASSTPSSQLPVKPNSKPDSLSKRGGAKPGHPGTGRKKHSPDELDEIREVNLQPLCPDCRSELVSKGHRQRCVIDIDPITVKNVLYRLERKICPSCGLKVNAKATEVLPKSLLSNQVLAEIVDSHYLQGIPLGRICQRWQLNYSTVIESLHRLRRIFADVMAELKKLYRASLVRQADETSWRVDG